MLDLEENGCPQVEDTDALVTEGTPVTNQNGEVTGLVPDDVKEVVHETVDPVVVEPVNESDFPERYQSDPDRGRWNGPFSARMKVTRSFILVTLKKTDTEETQSFFIPVRW